MSVSGYLLRTYATVENIAEVKDEKLVLSAND